ncbi:glycoside hydrolase family 19 protein [Rhodoligotrophos ferricapiens]|uniref:glycoside hydrolase family 19 protein n=1 Tax=Rhodoligotrophos ferricapiens TaxID=3069264 RepID=UPI00315D7382
MSINRNIFFADISARLFDGQLTRQQITGLDAILSHWEAWPQNEDLRHLAYMLATVHHETGGRFEQVREGFAKTDAEARRRVRKRPYGKPAPNGHVYYGRGFVQITWLENYKRVGDLIGVDLVDNPDLALNLYVATRILFEGMERGLFTGRRLDEYFNDTTDDPVGARAIININDQAQLIAGYHKAFLAALNAAQATSPQTSRISQLPINIPAVMSGGITAASGVITALLATLESPWALAGLAILVFSLAYQMSGRGRPRTGQRANAKR